MARRSDINWRDIEVDYRLGVETIKSIAKRHGVAESNLRRRAKAQQWQRDCAQTIRDATDRALAETVKTQAQEIGARIGAEKAREIELAVEEAVLTSVEVIQHHQREARRAMRAVSAILSELEALGRVMPRVEQELFALAAGDPGRLGVLERALGVKGRAETLDRAASAMTKIAAMERQAHNLDKDESAKGSEIDELLKTVHAERIARAS